MSLTEILESVRQLPNMNVRYAGLVEIDLGRREKIVYDRERKEFAKTYSPLLFKRPRDLNLTQTDDFLGLNEYIKDSVDHAKDLFNITRKYGLMTALDYEVELFAETFKDFVQKTKWI